MIGLTGFSNFLRLNLKFSSSLIIINDKKYIKIFIFMFSDYKLCTSFTFELIDKIYSNFVHSFQTSIGKKTPFHFSEEVNSSVCIFELCGFYLQEYHLQLMQKSVWKQQGCSDRMLPAGMLCHCFSRKMSTQLDCFSNYKYYVGLWIRAFPLNVINSNLFCRCTRDLHSFSFIFFLNIKWCF